MNTSTNRLEKIKRIGSCAGSGAALFCVRREPEPGLLTYCPKVDTKIQKILLGATFRVVLTPLSRHGTIIKIICERVPWYPSAKACPAAIKPTVQCFFPTLYQVLLFDFSSFGEKLFFCLRGYRRAIAQSAVQKQPERRALRPQTRFGAQPQQAALGAEIGCSSVHPPPNRRRMGGGGNLALLLGKQQTLHHCQQAIATPRKVGT